MERSGARESGKPDVLVRAGTRPTEHKLTSIDMKYAWSCGLRRLTTGVDSRRFLDSDSAGADHDRPGNREPHPA